MGMNMTQPQALLVQLDIQPDGEHFYGSSRDVPGLHVCGNTREEVCESAVAAIKFLFKHNRGVNVEVKPMADSFDSFAQPMAACDRFVALAA
jgi:predicted RNase H-like HicB family nuclease